MLTLEEKDKSNYRSLVTKEEKEYYVYSLNDRNLVKNKDNDICLW